MIAESLAARADTDPNVVFLCDSTQQLTFSDAWRAVEAAARELAHARGCCIGIPGKPEPQFFITLLALDLLECGIYLLPEPMESDRFALVGAEASGRRVPAAGRDRVGLFTSGTTGTPKAALHTWPALASRIHVSPSLAGARWLLTYNPCAFAGVQVFLHALLNGNTLVLGSGAPAALAQLAARERVTHISATPTFFRLLLATADPLVLERLRPVQLTLGGEAVDQGILDALRARFSSARITHIYASTEAGACFSVHDGRAGFPASYLSGNDAGVEMRIVNGALEIRSPAPMLGYLGDDLVKPPDFLPTGDMVVVRGARVYFLGRSHERINVGGSKVFPAEIEQALLELPFVWSARAHGVASPLVGQLVAADIVLEPGRTPSEARREILAHCRSRLEPYKVPRILRFPDGLQLTASGKLSRT